MTLFRNSIRLLPFLMLFGAVCAGATAVLPVDAGQAVDSSELIFTGRAVAHEVAVTADGKTPFTFVTFAVDEVFKGGVDGSEITLRFFGGPVGHEVVEASGMPRFEEQGRYLLFVEGNGRVLCPTVGWWQGRLQLVPHPELGEPILVDHRGAPVTGIRATKGHGPTWMKSEMLRMEDGDFVSAKAEGFDVLYQDGVELVEPASVTNKASILPAAQVLAQLRSLVDRRRLLKSFRVGQTVSSAHPSDLPFSFNFDRPAAQ